MSANPPSAPAGPHRKRQKTGGRQKGTPNKLTAPLKEAILLAAEGAHKEGMVGYLTQQAQENPNGFMTLLGKVLPTTLANDPTNPMPAAQVTVKLVRPTG